MTYTVKQVAKMANISVRTLHWYDEIGLLKPAYVGHNGYRYYEEEQLLKLQQILFYRELSFSLDEIERVMTSSPLNKVEALEAHKKALKDRLDQTQGLITTIEKTIAHIKGERKMRMEELFYDFDSDRQKEYEEYIRQHPDKYDPRHIAEARKRTKDWTDQDMGQFKEKLNKINEEIVAAIEAGVAPDSSQGQILARKQYDWICRCWTPDRESFKALASSYVEHEGFRAFYDAYHPQAATFLAKAMKTFADKRL